MYSNKNKKSIEKQQIQGSGQGPAKSADKPSLWACRVTGRHRKTVGHFSYKTFLLLPGKVSQPWLNWMFIFWWSFLKKSLYSFGITNIIISCINLFFKTYEWTKFTISCFCFSTKLNTTTKIRSFYFGFKSELEIFFLKIRQLIW